MLIIIFGFFFVTVSSRITGLIGTSSNPISGMTIATLILTCLLFVALGWTGDTYGPVALCVGAVVCIAAANAGNTSQDLKTGYIVGATPLYQQIGLIIGVVASAFVIGMTTLYLHRVFGIGSHVAAAPQATLMATIIKGLLSQNLPWGLVLVGVFISVTLELCGIHSLSFAVGSYLPIATTAPIFAGGLVRGGSNAGRGVGGIRARRRHAVQLRADRRRVDLRHPVRGPRSGRNRSAKPRRIGNCVPVPARRHGRRDCERAAVLRAGGRHGARGAEEDHVRRDDCSETTLPALVPWSLLAATVSAQPPPRRADEHRGAASPIRASITCVRSSSSARSSCGHRRARASTTTARRSRGVQGLGAGRHRRSPRRVLGSRPHERRRPAAGRLRPASDVQDRSRRRVAAARPGDGDHRVGTSRRRAPPLAPSIRNIVLYPSRYLEQQVTVTGQFGGRNLLGDLPDAPARSRYDFVMRSADAAIWVTNLRPQRQGLRAGARRAHRHRPLARSRRATCSRDAGCSGSTRRRQP